MTAFDPVHVRLDGMKEHVMQPTDIDSDRVMVWISAETLEMWLGQQSVS